MKRIDSVDGLRAIACFLVIVQHVAESYNAIAGSGHALLESSVFMNYGRVGVVAFFAISGYVIPFSLRGERVEGTRQFAIRRFWRLYPPLWVALALAYLLLRPAPALEVVAIGATMMPSFFGYAHAMGHLWTLEVELTFYALAALLYVAFGKLDLKVIVGSYLFFILWFNEGGSVDLPGHWPGITMHMAIMLWGSTCRALTELSGDFRFMRCNCRQIKVAGIAAATTLMFWRPIKSTLHGFQHDSTDHISFGLSNAGGLLLFLVWVVIAQVGIPKLAKLGRATYSTYLIHSIVFYSLLTLLNKPWAEAARGLNIGLYIAGVAALSFAFGELLFRFIELPSNALGKRIASK